MDIPFANECTKRQLTKERKPSAAQRIVGQTREEGRGRKIRGRAKSRNEKKWHEMKTTRGRKELK